MKTMDFVLLYVIAFAIRLVLLLYGEWQDANADVKFTDVDYWVFSDAAEFVTMGDSPYRRATYRYSPILAWILTPNVYIHKSWGKLVFVCMDLLTAYFVQRILQLRNCQMKMIKFALCLWLFNPVTMSVSCRGNAESVMSTLVLGLMYSLLKKHTVIAAILFGIAVHFKIYPVVYTLSLLLFLGGNYNQKKGEISVSDIKLLLTRRKLVFFTRKLFSFERLLFVGTAVLTFSISTLTMYWMYGFDFIEHAYLYHVSRRDVRHNFSVYFYMLYINNNIWLSLLCFINQFAAIFVISFTHYNDLPFCFFVLTYVFVTFNKICTSQYFLWYISLVPVLVSGLQHIPLKATAIPVGGWFLGQALWLFPAYLLEFKGLNTFNLIWMAGIIFFAINVSVTEWFVHNYHYQTLFNDKGVLTSVTPQTSVKSE